MLLCVVGGAGIKRAALNKSELLGFHPAGNAAADSLGLITDYC
jgi:hypothetical protein